MIALARGNTFDGLELDYEVTNNGIGASEYDFLVALVKQIRLDWPEGVISMSSMEWTIEDTSPPPAKNYNTVLTAIGGDIDFVSVQFYNHGPVPLTDTAALVSEAEGVIGALGGGDTAAAKVVVGLVMNPADSINAAYAVPIATGACGVLKPLVSKYSTSFGGVMLWQIKSDADGEWLKGVSGCLG
jgi:chitinase